MSEAEPIGVLVMAYGTAAGPEDVERYYTDIRGGWAPSPEHLAELLGRYAAIGNRFPLLEITRAEAEGLERELNLAEPGRFRAYLGMKHSPPFIAEGVERMRADGIRRAVGIVMAPHWSGMSVDDYAARVERATGGEGPAFTFVPHWYDHSRFVEFLSDRVAAALAKLPDEVREEAAVIFSAHSLPQRDLEDGTTRCLHCRRCDETGCRYLQQLRHTGELVAARLGLPTWAIGWQSAGRTADPWLGPPIEDVIVELGEAGHRGVVVCSAGFVADHLEILYDLDIEAQEVAAGAGVTLVRTEMPNADPAFVAALAEVVRDHLAAEDGRAP